MRAGANQASPTPNCPALSTRALFAPAKRGLKYKNRPAGLTQTQQNHTRTQNHPSFSFIPEETRSALSAGSSVEPPPRPPPSGVAGRTHESRRLSTYVTTRLYHKKPKTHKHGPHALHSRL